MRNARARMSNVFKAAMLASTANVLIAFPASAQTAAGTAAPPGAQTSTPNAVAVDTNSQQSEIIVTGTQIRGVSAVGSNLIAITQQDVIASGASNVIDLLRDVPQVFNIGVSETSRGNAGGPANAGFTSAINIRGISPFATLTLFNGHRMVRSGSRGETVDPTSIPTNMLQNVQIVADGGSAIYGADAIAGVANLIPRRGMQGIEVSGRFGRSNRGLGEETASLTAGTVWSTGQITAGIQYNRRSNVQVSELANISRDQTAFGGADLRQLNCQPGNIQIGSTFYPIPAGGVTPATAGVLVAGAPNKCEPYRSGDVIPQQRRVAFAATFDQDITDNLRFRSDMFGSFRKFELNYSPFSTTLTVPSTNAFYVAPVGATVPLCSAAVNAQFGTPAGTRCETVLYNFANDTGARNPYYGNSRTFQITGGLIYDLPYKWRLTGDYTFGFSGEKVYDRSFSRTNAANLNRALASSNPATALNVFGGASNPSLFTYAGEGIFNQIFDPNSYNVSKVIDLKADGPLFELPGGTVRAAIGVQQQNVTLSNRFLSGRIESPTLTRTYVRRRSRSAFGELNIPIIASDNNVPLVESLEVNVAGRIDKYNDVGTTKNPKIGFRYTPVSGLNINGSYGTSFRSPNINDLYAATTSGTLNQIADPTCGCNVIALFLSGANRAVKPETAKTYSLGVDYTPSFAPALHVSINYFKLALSKQISSFLSNTAILTQENQFGGTSVINRVTSVAQVQSALNGVLITQGTLPADLSQIRVIIDGRPLNLGTTRAEGIDFTASYRIDAGELGKGVVGTDGEVFTRYENQSLPAAVPVDRLNDIFFPPKWRARYYAGWTYGGLNARLTVNHLGGYNNTLVTPNQRIRASTTTDLHLDYRFDAEGSLLKGLTIGLDVSNLFDQKPPLVLGNGSGILGAAGGNFNAIGFDPTTANPFGRLISATLTKSF